MHVTESCLLLAMPKACSSVQVCRDSLRVVLDTIKIMLPCLQERLLAALVLSASNEDELNHVGGQELLTAFNHCNSCRGTDALCLHALYVACQLALLVCKVLHLLLFS